MDPDQIVLGLPDPAGPLSVDNDERLVSSIKWQSVSCESDGGDPKTKRQKAENSEVVDKAWRHLAFGSQAVKNNVKMRRREWHNIIH